MNERSMQTVRDSINHRLQAALMSYLHARSYLVLLHEVESLRVNGLIDGLTADNLITTIAADALRCAPTARTEFQPIGQPIGASLGTSGASLASTLIDTLATVAVAAGDTLATPAPSVIASPDGLNPHAKQSPPTIQGEPPQSPPTIQDATPASPDADAEQRLCPYPGCNRPISKDALACQKHWRWARKEQAAIEDDDGHKPEPDAKPIRSARQLVDVAKKRRLSNRDLVDLGIDDGDNE